ncbi:MULTISPECIES: hypothetical protein [unclassified Chromohalobacter]|uniref:hypothetical protein n=1 Tax=unclassified Chromohalobacter TaxID=2628571 RepID=UPI0024689020|nr:MULTISPECIES: hypothetical protein [unclassified Chromohalobacter]
MDREGHGAAVALPPQDHGGKAMNEDFSVELRLPKGCPNCGSHKVTVSQAQQPDDIVFCSSCSTEVCDYQTARQMLDEMPRSENEKLIEDVVNNRKPSSTEE